MGAEAGGCWKSCAPSPWDGNGAVPGPSPLQGGSPQAPLLPPAAQPRCPCSSSPPPQPGWTGGRGGGHTQTHPGPVPASPPQRVHVSSRGPGWGSNTQPGRGAEKGGEDAVPGLPDGLGESLGPPSVPGWRGTRSVLGGGGGGAGRGGRGSQLGLRVGLASLLSLTRHSLDLRLARDLQLGREAREPQSPSMEGVGSFPGGGTERASRGLRVATGTGTGSAPLGSPGCAADGLGTPWLCGQRP